MSAAMVKLRPTQLGCRPVLHPLLRRVPKSLSESQIQDLRLGCLAGCNSARETLVLGHLAMLRHTVGRYLYHWPITRRFIDEMVSAGVYALVRAAARLDAQTWPDVMGHYLLNNVCAEVEDEVARLRGICPAPPSTNRRRRQNGEAPIFGEAEDMATERSTFSKDDPLPEFVDVLEGVRHLKDTYPRQAYILAREFWGLSDSDLAAKLCVSRQTVQRSRLSLLKRYLELGGV